MEAVRAFNNELSSLYESKPPVSRAKMAQVTKCAIKAIKFYKHVVQSVEKFIQKCKPEYKIPGLYVIDSIVRQSRHQFGSDKDVFSPRFTKNIVTTFTNLFKCPVDERSRVVRVLNLWQKNNVFPMEVIQPLLDLAADPENPDLVVAAQRAVDAVVSATQKVPLPGIQASSNGSDSNSNQILQQTEMLATITKLLQQAQEVSLTGIAPESQLQQLQHLQQQLIMQTERISKPHQQPTAPIDSNLLAQIQVLTNQLLSKASGGGDDIIDETDKMNSAEPLFNKKLLDFDYDDSDEDEDRQEQQHHHHHHHHYQERPPPLMMQHGMPPMMQEQNVPHRMPPMMQEQNVPHRMPPMMQEQNHLQQIQIQQMAQQQEQLQSEIGAQEQLRRRVLEQQQSDIGAQEQLRRRVLEQQQSEIGAQEQLRRRVLEQQQQQFDREIGQAAMIGIQPPHGFNENMDTGPNNDPDEPEIQEVMDRTDVRRQRGSRERSRSPRRRSRRSRSKSRDRRRRSRSRDRHRRSRSRDRERRDREKEREKERERERERKKRGLPPLRENHISICSTTLWFGHLAKNTSEEELRELIEEFGTVRTINMIPPRGCAFVCLTKRKGAFKAMDRLRGVKIYGSGLKVAWAPGIGVKESVFKDLWDVDLGVTYIPWDQLPADVTPLIAGGMVDEDSLPERLKGMKTGEEETTEPPPPQEDPHTEEANLSDDEDDMMATQQQTQQMPHGLPRPNFPMGPGALEQNLLTLLKGPLSLLGTPPPLGLPPALGGSMGLGGPANMAGMNSLRLPGMNSIGGLGNMRGLPGPGPNLAGMRPGQINMGHQGPMMGQGNRMGGPNPGINIRPYPSGMNPPAPPRGPFGQFDVPRFQHLQNQGGMRPPFFNNINNNRADSDSDQPGVEDGDQRAMAEPKEWPPDDEVNAEDEQDDDLPVDSDDRIFPSRGSQNMGRPNLPNIRPLGNLLGPRGMLPGPGHPNPMLGMPRAQSPNPGMPSLRPLRMMPPGQQQSAQPMPGGPGHNFALAQAGMRLPMPGLRMRPGIPPPPSPPHLLPPSTRASLPVTANGSMIVTSPELPLPDRPLGERDSPDLRLPGPDMLPHPDDDFLRLPPPAFMMRMMQEGNRPPFRPFPGRGFAPLNFRPRHDGLLGAHPDGQDGGRAFDRFRGLHPMRPFGRMDRPPFGRRFDLPFHPPLGFLDFDERDDRGERRLLPRFDLDDHPRLHDLDDRHLPHFIDERRSNEMRGGHPDLDMLEHIAQRSRRRDGSGRASRWHDDDDRHEFGNRHEDDDMREADNRREEDDRREVDNRSEVDHRREVAGMHDDDDVHEDDDMHENDKRRDNDYTSKPAPVVDNSPTESKDIPAASPPPVEEEPVSTRVESNLVASPVASNASPVASNASPVASDASPVASNASPVAFNASPVASNASPVASNASPVASNASPVASNASPVASNASPEAFNASPEASNASPEASNASPVASDASPVASDAIAGKDPETAVISKGDGTPEAFEPPDKTVSEGESITEVNSPCAETGASS